MREFTYVGHPTRVVFGTRTLNRLRDEVELLGRSRALILGTATRTELTARARDVLGPLAAAEFAGVVPHTPVEVTEAASEVLREAGADCLVAVGGSSATGLSKALALRTGLPQVVVPTTYAGSEATPVLGQTRDGVKTTLRDPRLRPQSVVYDVDLTLSLPVAFSVTSGVNALAHAVEALYAPQTDPVTDRLATGAVALLASALPRIAADPGDREARADALQAAWLAGTCLGTVGMGLHHKLCHTLGGTFGLEHAATHTVILPHAMAYNAAAAPEAMAAVARALGGAPDAATGVHDLIRSLGGPLSLRELGMAEEDLARAAELATAEPYPNPRPTTRDEISALLHDAWAGRRPAPADPLRQHLADLRDEVVASFAGTPDARLRQLLTSLTEHAHAFVADNGLTEAEWRAAVDFLTRVGQISDATRQEAVLLSDTLGISSAVDLLTNSRAAGATPSAVLGPFFVEGAPRAENGADLAASLPGTPLYADLAVAGERGEPLPGAWVEVWQADDDGLYDAQVEGLDTTRLRARFTADAQGRVRFRSIVPPSYPIPEDGPVGRFLRSVGRHPYRAPHVHFMIGAPGHRRLVTQLFVAGGEWIDADTVFGVKEPLVVEFSRHEGPTPDGRPGEGTWCSLDYVFRLVRDR
ncbi:maleylacetate reductase and hydroxyquinol 1,2-dioxygenase domain-containing protein [Catenulispora subtropica]|uniref:Maleylacetate reductase and hydroxyquinol 1,2-dioxygenase domain-containing protein n=1 Tax=Catenulispora subtropica TaxID=450798 RepID=A0ABP5EJC3_9ACTN